MPRALPDGGRPHRRRQRERARGAAGRRGFFRRAELATAEAEGILGRLSTTAVPTPPEIDLDGLEGKALARAQEDRQYRKALAEWRAGVTGGLWFWEAAVLRASTSASDVATLMRETLPTVARALVRSSLHD